MRGVHWGVWTTGIAALALAAALSFGTILSMRGQIRELSEQLAGGRPKAMPPVIPGVTGDATIREARKLRDEADHLNRRAGQARVEAEKARSEAIEIRRLADEMTFRESEKMHLLYPDLKQLDESNRVDEVTTFRITGSPILSTGSHVVFEHANRTKFAASPNFQINFLDRNGFALDSVVISWRFSSVEPGETRVEEKDVNFLRGTPVYFVVKFPR